MGGEISRDGDEYVPTLVGAAPLAELAHAGLQHLIGVEARVLAQQPPRQRGEQRTRRVAEGEMACHKARREVDLSLPVKGVEQSGAQRRGIGGQIVQPVVAITGNAGWRHVEIAGEIERHRAIQNGAHGLGMAIPVDGPDPRQHPVNGVSIGEDVVGRLPVGVLVGTAEACHPKRRRIGEGAAEVGRSGPARTAALMASMMAAGSSPRSIGASAA